MRRLRKLMIFVSALALVPFLMMVLTLGLATLFGCDVNESGPQTCMVFGSDWGELLSGMLTAGWMGLVTIPLLMCIFVIWLAVEALAWWRRRRRQRRAMREAAA